MRAHEGARPFVEAIEPRLLLAASPVHAVKQAEVAARVSAKLLELHDDVLAGRNADQAAKAERLRVDAKQRVGVTVRADDVDAVSKALTPFGFEATASFPALHFAEGVLPIRALRAVQRVAAQVGRFGIRPSYEPIRLAGSVNSQADFVMEADRVRATLPASVNGSGQRIGALSDSYDRLGGAAADVASGDLPSSGVTVVQEASAGGTDEGRGMLQLIHDLAPGAALGFATAGGGEGNFANNIRRLANPADPSGFGGATVIVDDVVYFSEPMFQDGIVAQAIDEVVTTRGVNYFTSSGNQSTQAYESTTFQTDDDSITFPGGGIVNGTFYDFDPQPNPDPNPDPETGVDTRQRITVPGNGRVTLTFQWDDPFYTSNGVDTDLDIFLIDPVTDRVVAAAESDNIFFQDAYEIVGYQNPTGSPIALDVAILRFAGPNSGRIKYVNYGNTVTFNEWATNSPTVIPHAAAVNGQGVGAVPYFNQGSPEGFTSKGPSTILFSPSGAPITPEVRQTPQVTAIDGTNTTFFGSDIAHDADASPNFFGTSAAAPHAAAVAALVRQANPSFTPSQVYSRLQDTADDVGPTGFDNLTGFGLINAYDAVYPTITPATPNFADGLEGGALSAAYETRSTGAGRIQVTGADGPFAGSRHLVLDGSGVTSNGLNEVTLHVNASGAGTKTLAFRQREFADDDNAMPATFSGSNNSDGVALSVDGVNWFRLVSLTGAASSGTYAAHQFDLSAFATANGLTLTADTRIKFQQFGSAATPNEGFAFDDISVTSVVPDTAPPTVSAVFVRGSTWVAGFNNFLASSGVGEAAFGFRVSAADQLNELPWTNLNRVSVRFSEPVNVQVGDLVVRGIKTPVYPFAASNAFAYDAATNTATWTLAASLTNERLLLDLDADAGTGGVTDTAGNALDGEWTDPTGTNVSGDAFPSGNGTAGGDFRFRLHVLPGDVNRNGNIQGNDVTLVRNAQGATPGGALYTIFKDVNGSANIQGNDVTLVRNRQGTTVPAGTFAREAGTATLTSRAPEVTFSSAASRPVTSVAPQRITLEPALQKSRLTDGLV